MITDTDIKTGMHTPWGVADHVIQHGPGLWFVETPSHGGFWLSPERQAQISETVVPFLTRHGRFTDRSWWEEDCDGAFIALFFSDEVLDETANGHDAEIERLTKWATAFNPEREPVLAARRDA